MDKHTLRPPPPFESGTWNFPKKIFHDTLREEHWHVEQYKPPVEKYQNPHTNMSSVRDLVLSIQHVPQSEMSTSLEGWPVLEPTASILATTSIPSITLPNTTCLPSSLKKQKQTDTFKEIRQICTLAVGYLQIWKHTCKEIRYVF